MSVLIENVTKRFGKPKKNFKFDNIVNRNSKNLDQKTGQVVALNKVTMEFEENKITALIGFNGSGKTTAFNIITNLIEKYDGKVVFKNKEWWDIQQKEISFLSASFEPQNIETVDNHLKYIGYLYGMKKKEIFLKTKTLMNEVEFQANGKTRIKNLSKGNHQKLKLIATLMNPNMKYLFLDEPFDGLDPIMIKKITKILIALKEKVTIIITSHRMDIIDEMCDEFYILKDGNVIRDSKDQGIKNKTSSILLEVETSSNLDGLQKLSYVISVKKREIDTWVIEISNIKKFREISIELLKDKNYVAHSLLKLNIVEGFFEGYHDE